MQRAGFGLTNELVLDHKPFWVHLETEDFPMGRDSDKDSVPITFAYVIKTATKENGFVQAIQGWRSVRLSRSRPAV